MPRAGFRSARRSRNTLVWAPLLGGLILAGPGCQRHYYYYYGNSGDCPPMAPASIVEGPVCDVPGPVIEGGSVVSSAADDPPAAKRSRRNKVVVSEAYNGRKSSWKASDPDSSMARTQIDGAIDDSVRK